MGETQLGNRLLAERLRLGAESGQRISQRKVADLLLERGVYKSEHTVGNWERGRAQVPLEVLPDLAAIFDVPEQEFLDLHLADHYGDSGPSSRLPHSTKSGTGTVSEGVAKAEPEAGEAARTTRPERRFARPIWVAALAASLAAIVSASWFGAGAAKPSPDTARQLDDWVKAFADGERLWRKSFPGMDAGAWSTPQVVDINGDGRREVLANLRPENLEAYSGRLVSLTSSGEVDWSFEYGRPVSRGERDFLVYQGADPVWIESGPWVLANARHATWYPTQISLLDPATGDLVSEYWHPGYLVSHLEIDLDDDGSQELLLGGINNPESGLGHPSIVALDLPFATDPDHLGFFGQTRTRVRSYLLLPRPDVFDVDGDLVVTIKFWTQGDVIHAGVGAANQWLVDFAFDRDLELVDIYVGDTYIQKHDLLFHAGFLDHPFDARELEDLKRIGRFRTTPDGNQWSPGEVDGDQF